MREYIDGKTELQEGEKILSVKAGIGEGFLVDPIVKSAKVQVAHALGELFLTCDEVVVNEAELEMVKERVEEEVDGRCSFVEIDTNRVEVWVRTKTVLREREEHDADPGDKVWVTPGDWQAHRESQKTGTHYPEITKMLEEMGANPELAEEVYDRRRELFTCARVVQKSINSYGARVWVSVENSYEFKHQKKLKKTPIFKVDSKGRIKPMTVTDVREWIAKVNKDK